MTAFAFPVWSAAFFAPRAREIARTDPPIAPARAPVFIHDAITPYRGETLLLSYLRADAERALQQAKDDETPGAR